MLSGLVRAGVIKSLTDIVRTMPDEIEKADEETAKLVSERAQARAFQLGGVHGHVGSGIEAGNGIIELNVVDQPAILGAEFGGGGSPRTRQFPPWGTEGYMVYPELHEDDVAEAYEEALDDLID